MLAQVGLHLSAGGVVADQSGVAHLIAKPGQGQADVVTDTGMVLADAVEGITHWEIGQRKAIHAQIGFQIVESCHRDSCHPLSPSRVDCIQPAPALDAPAEQGDLEYLFQHHDADHSRQRPVQHQRSHGDQWHIHQPH